MIRYDIPLKKQVKTSNALLILLLITTGLLYGSYVVSVNGKFYRKEYTFVNNDKLLYVKEKLATGKVIRIENIKDCLLVGSDSVSVEVSRDEKNLFDIYTTQDTISIRATSTPFRRILIYLPSGTRIVAKSSELELRGSFDFKHQSEYNILLVASGLVATATTNSHVFFNHLRIAGDGQSSLRVDERVHIQTLELDAIKDVRLAKGWQVHNLLTRSQLGSQLNKRGDSVSVVTY